MEILKKIKQNYIKHLFIYKVYRIFKYKPLFSHSSFGEEILVNRILKKKHGFYIDVGALNPKVGSLSFLLYKKGWRGINIDINPTSTDLFKILRPEDFNFCTTLDENKRDFEIFYDHPLSPANTLDESYYKKLKGNTFKDISKKMVKSKSADEILNFTKITNVDFLNIDVEGMDFKMLTQLVPNKIKPKLISIETHNVDGSKSKDCDKINDYLNNCSFRILKRAGPSTLFYR